MQNFREALKSARLFFDGAMGTQLQRLTSLDPMAANLLVPEAVSETHRLYRAAGADVVTANTFGAYPHKYDNFKEIIQAAIQNARRAGEGFVAMDMGPTGRLMRPMGDMRFNEAFNIFRQAAQTGADCGADFILIETMTDLYETKCAVLAAKETGLPVVATVTLDARGRMLTGADLSAAAALLEALGADAMGVNCGLGPDVYVPLARELLKTTCLPVLVQPNAGLPEIIDGKAVYKLTPGAFARSMKEIAALGANLLGGCCGTSPAHMRAVKEACQAMPFAERNAEKARRVSSGVKAVVLDDAVRIAYCKETGAEDIIDEAMELAEEAGIIGITVKDAETVVAVQEFIRAPLLLDAPSEEILREVVRVYNGVPLLDHRIQGLQAYALLTREAPANG